ncbi:SWI/SNF complex component SNF12 homolog [Cornus florida]|uniref:SWI/SNF complex component SNF12 homolog n=1 Tax=Cornus florida TaxID=4283 RepID=UPI00289B3EFF|nr:SWI/SNF complex component SNF12 homolog [Cornus florida]XP_059640615.1 SWI/SNF complex component SNF12 homolog [Cornus florida]XP_059640616.1 SWI/SNF complex component SNF12 homolog [Cornus florida]
MSMNNNNPMKNVGVPIPFGSPGAMPQSMPMNHQSHLLSQSHHQTQGGPHFPGHFQLSEPQAQALAQAQYAQAHAQAQAQAAHAQFKAQLQAQPLPHTQLQNPGTSNVGVSSPLISAPGTGNAKRAPQKPPSRPPGSSGTGSASPLKTMELTPAARRKKRKLPEKQIPDKVAALLPESALYTQLLEFEARVDAALLRKKIDIQESLKNPPRVQKTLRIYVFNTFANQTQMTPEKKNAEPPSWSLKIIGRILEDGVDPDAAGTMQRQGSSYPKFSSFFKKITIYLDQSLYSDNHVILWESARSPALHEGFEVKRKGDKEFTAIIRLEMNYVPEKFKLSQALSEVLGIEVETRPRIIAAFWHYVKARKLQIPSDPSFFMCDPPLRKVFGEEKMKFAMVPQKISQHLIPPQPIHLEHKIKLSGNNPTGNTCYDVLVDVPFSLEKEMSAFLANLEKHKEIDACDDAICSALKKIHEHRRRRAFFLGFSQSPAEFINSLIASQSRDLKLVAGDASRSAEKERRSDFYGQPWVEDAVIRYLNRKPTAGSDALGST